jgi:hypothetical protein
MVLASPGPLLTPPPSSSPQKTIRSYSAQTPPRNGNPTQLPPGGRGGRRRGRGTGGGRPERALGRHRRAATPPQQRELRRGCQLTTLQPTAKWVWARSAMFDSQPRRAACAHVPGTGHNSLGGRPRRRTPQRLRYTTVISGHPLAP